MVTPDGRRRVEEIRVEHGGRTLTRLWVTTYGGVFVGEVADVDQLAVLGVPLAELVEDKESGHTDLYPARGLGSGSSRSSCRGRSVFSKMPDGSAQARSTRRRLVRGRCKRAGPVRGLARSVTTARRRLPVLAGGGGLRRFFRLAAGVGSAVCGAARDDLLVDLDLAGVDVLPEVAVGVLHQLVAEHAPDNGRD